MAPKRKVAQKQPKPSVDIIPEVIENMSHITVRRPPKDNLVQKDEKDVSKVPISPMNTMHMNASVVLEQIPAFKVKVPELTSESELIELFEEELNKKPVEKKVAKTKLKSKKLTVEEDSKATKTRKRAASEDRQVLKVEEKAVSKSRKRPVDKNLLESQKPVSPLNELPKRNRRAASVDILTSETTSNPPEKGQKKNKVNSKSTKAVIVGTEDDGLKKPKKGSKKEDQLKIMETEDEEKKILETNSKGKKNTKKGSNEEKENVLTEQKDVEVVLNSNQDKPKSKRGIKKIIIDEPVEDENEEHKAEKVPKSRSRAASKVMVKQNSENDKEKKQKSILKTKKVIKSPEQSNESSEINDTDDSTKSPEIKPKRERKFKQNDFEQKDDNFKDIKARKRVGRNAQMEDFDKELQQESPPAEQEINLESGNLADDYSDVPELEKEVVKPIAAKRKTKAKSKK